jgi:ATP-dependent Lon protease
VGGIKHKLLAAYRADITEVILPKLNDKDLEEIPSEVREVLQFHLVESMDEVLSLALEREPVPGPQVGAELQKTSPEPPVESDSIAH